MFREFSSFLPFKWIAVISLAVFISSCSKVVVYDASSNDQEEGIMFYYPKPHLLITISTKTKDGTEIEKTVSSQIVYLPDLDNPKVAKLKPGFGSSNLSLGLTNGVLTAVGQQSDSKIPETISSIGGIASSLFDPTELAGDEGDNFVRLFEITKDGLEEVQFSF